MTGQARIVIAESTGAKPSLTDLTLKKDALYPLNIQSVRPWTQIYKKIKQPFKGLLNTWLYVGKYLTWHNS